MDQQRSELFWKSFLLPAGVLACWLVLPLTSGCWDDHASNTIDEPFEVAAPDPLTVLIIGDTELGPKLIRQWKSRRDGKLTVVNQSQTEWQAADFSIGADVDLVIYPPIQLGQLAESNVISPISHALWNTDAIDKNAFLNHYARAIVRYQNKPLAVPLGNPHFAMIYDQKQLGVDDTLGPRLPVTWDQLAEICQQRDTKVALPLASGWAGHTFVCRVAASLRTAGSFSVLFERSTMKPLIDRTPFVQALEQLQAIASEDSVNLDPAQSFAAVTDGNAVAALGWPATGQAAAQDETQRGTFAVQLPPRSQRLYDSRRDQWKKRSASEDSSVAVVGMSGLLISMIQGNRHESSAIEFMQWIGDRQILISVFADSPLTGPVRVSHLGNINRWTGDGISLELSDEYADVIRQTHKLNLVVLFPRIPGAHRYYAALDEQIRAALQGEKTAQQALQAAASDWEQITESLGRKEQIRAMRHESGF